MTPSNADTGRDTKPAKPKSQRTERLSPDGKWKSFPKVPHLLQYVPTGAYFARVKVQCKLIRQRLEHPVTHEPITVYSDAVLLLPDFLKRHRKSKRHTKGAPAIFRDARLAYEADLDNNHTIADSHRNFRKWCIQSLLKSWPQLDDMRLTNIKAEHCKEWGKRFSETGGQGGGQCGPQYFNNVRGTLKAIFERAGYDEQDNPMSEVGRLGVPICPPQLPEPEQFTELLLKVESHIANTKAHHCADLVRFLAFSGCRLKEAQQVLWRDVNFEAGTLTVHNVKTRKAKSHRPTRLVPIIPDMLALLTKLKASNPSPDDRVCRMATCADSLAKACEEIKIPKLTHHDLRHLFATRCIEAGVDIPTVSRWLGHSDGGALAMKVYGHLRERHSAAMAQRVTFSATTAGTKPKPETAMKGAQANN